MKFNGKMLLCFAFSALPFMACSDDSSSSSEEIIEDDGGTVLVDSTGTDTSVTDTTATDSTTDSTTTSTSNVGEITATTGIGYLLDDFEDGDGIANNGNYWYTYNDNDNDGASVITTPLDDAGEIISAAIDNGSAYAFKVNYTLDQGSYAYDPYVGWGVQFEEDDSNDKYGGISYWYLGGAHEVHIETSDIKDYDVHLASVKASRVWKQVTIRFKDLTQGGWGEEVDFDAKHINAISFQAKGSSGSVVTDSLFIDNIYLQDTSEVEADVADMEIKEAVIPDVSYTADEIAVSSSLQTKAMTYLDKGVSFTNWLEEADGRFKSFEFGESDVKILAENGFKCLRLPIDLDLYVTNRDAFVDGEAEELLFDDDTLFMVLDSFVEWTSKYGLSFVIDYHEYDNSYNATSADNENYIKMMAGLWKHVAEHYASSDREDLFFELLNEPDMTYGKVTADQWTVAAQAIIDSIRSVNTKHTLVFGDAQWYSATLLAKRTPFTDDNIVYAIHTYEPFVFTHQGGSWTDYATIKNIPFPYSTDKWSEYSSDFGITSSTLSYVKSAVKNYYKTGNKNYIINQILSAKKWAATNNVPIIINEFGALNTRSTAESRLNYLTAMGEISEELEIPLTHWGYTGGFAVIENGELIEGIADALGLNK